MEPTPPECSYGFFSTAVVDDSSNAGDDSGNESSVMDDDPEAELPSADGNM